jgi:hypothetical protein
MAEVPNTQQMPHSPLTHSLREFIEAGDTNRCKVRYHSPSLVKIPGERLQIPTSSKVASIHPLNFGIRGGETAGIFCSSPPAAAFVRIRQTRGLCTFMAEVTFTGVWHVVNSEFSELWRRVSLTRQGRGQSISPDANMKHAYSNTFQ